MAGLRWLTDFSNGLSRFVEIFNRVLGRLALQRLALQHLGLGGLSSQREATLLVYLVRLGHNPDRPHRSCWSAQ